MKGKAYPEIVRLRNETDPEIFIQDRFGRQKTMPITRGQLLNMGVFIFRALPYFDKPPPKRSLFGGFPMKILEYNKATVPMMINALVMLVNGRLSEDIRLTGDELGWALILLTGVVAYLVPNAMPKADNPEDPPATGIGA